jgi:hypothetical protein
VAVAKIVIEFNYDLDSHYGDSVDHTELKTNEIIDDLEDTVYEDLLDLMRGDRLRSWSEFEILENESID